MKKKCLVCGKEVRRDSKYCCEYHSHRYSQMMRKARHSSFEESNVIRKGLHGFIVRFLSMNALFSVLRHDRPFLKPLGQSVFPRRNQNDNP